MNDYPEFMIRTPENESWMEVRSILDFDHPCDYTEENGFEGGHCEQPASFRLQVTDDPVTMIEPDTFNLCCFHIRSVLLDWLPI